MTDTSRKVNKVLLDGLAFVGAKYAYDGNFSLEETGLFMGGDILFTNIVRPLIFKPYVEDKFNFDSSSKMNQRIVEAVERALTTSGVAHMFKSGSYKNKFMKALIASLAVSFYEYEGLEDQLYMPPPAQKLPVVDA